MAMTFIVILARGSRKRSCAWYSALSGVLFSNGSAAFIGQLHWYACTATFAARIAVEWYLSSNQLSKRVLIALEFSYGGRHRDSN